MPFKLCFGKSEKETYRVLDYSHYNLLNVPTDIYDHAPTLEELYLDSNQLKDLPKALFTLQQLKLLNISDNEIISLPSNVSNLCHLVEFDISKNGFLELPDNIKGMKSVEHFDLSVNPLGRLPDGFTMLLNLTHVYLNDTFLDFLPANIGRMAKLEVLEVRDNHLTLLPKSMSRLTCLRRLDIGTNEFNELPEVIGSFVNLEELWCDGNKIKSLPPDMGNLKKLQFVDATENLIEWVADELGECERLTDLHLTTNNLVQLPENLCKLKLMETLKVDDNHLTFLPTSIGGLANLDELIVSGNELETLPPGIGLLRKLRTLNADENYIDYLPDEIGSCIGLTVVSLRTNRLKALPDDIGRLSNLAVLNVSSNILEHLPYSMMKLKKLKALWLSENQAKPLIPLQMEWDAANEKRYLTCYMFPQRPLSEVEAPSLTDQRSFHASLFEEEWKKRTSVLFDVEDDDQQVVRLSRQPTPFPKEIRNKITNFRNQAIAKGQVADHDGHLVVPHGANHVINDDGSADGSLNPPNIQLQPPENGSVSTASSSSCIAEYPNQPYASHDNNTSSHHMSNEEQDLLHQLKNTSLASKVEVENPADIERQRMQNAFRKYQDDLKKISGGDNNQTEETMGSASPVGRRFVNSSNGLRKDEGYTSAEGVHLTVDKGRDIKSSSDSGLGSGELTEEQAALWKSGYPAIPEQEDVFRVTIHKTPHLGFSVSGGVDAPGNPFSPGDLGIFITKVLPDGPAADHLQPGDKVLEVNGIDFRAMLHEKAVGILKASNTVDMLICRKYSP